MNPDRPPRNFVKLHSHFEPHSGHKAKHTSPKVSSRQRHSALNIPPLQFLPARRASLCLHLWCEVPLTPPSSPWHKVVMDTCLLSSCCVCVTITVIEEMEKIKRISICSVSVLILGVAVGLTHVADGYLSILAMSWLSNCYQRNK